MKIISVVLLMSISMFSIAHSKKIKDGPLIPIVRIAPQYPFNAYLGSVPGWVKVKMTINAKGSVDEVEVIDSRPRKVFDKEAIRSAMKFKFKPRVKNGQAVASHATQTFEFDHGLPDEITYEIKEQLVQLMFDRIKELKPVRSKVILADSIKIQSKIKPKDLTSVDFYYSDDLLVLNTKPHFWEYNQKNSNEIHDFQEQLKKRTEMVKAQYDNHPGIYNKFHRIYLAKNHPPELLSKVDYKPSTKDTTITNERFKLTIDESGKVKDWTDLNNKKMSKYPAYRDRVEERLSELTFLPAFKNGRPVKDKITIEFSTVSVSKIQAIDENLVLNQHHVIEIPWVKLVALRNKKGHVVEVKVMASSDESLEPAFIKDYQKHKFDKSDINIQVLELVKFDPED